LLSLSRDEFGNICLIIVAGGKKQVFKLEESLSKMYGRQIKEGKATLEFQLLGGSVVNVLIQNHLNPPSIFEDFLDKCKTVMEDPDKARDLDLQPKE